MENYRCICKLRFVLWMKFTVFSSSCFTLRLMQNWLMMICNQIAITIAVWRMLCLTDFQLLLYQLFLQRIAGQVQRVQVCQKCAEAVEQIDLKAKRGCKKNDHDHHVWEIRLISGSENTIIWLSSSCHLLQHKVTQVTHDMNEWKRKTVLTQSALSMWCASQTKRGNCNSVTTAPHVLMMPSRRLKCDAGNLLSCDCQCHCVIQQTVIMKTTKKTKTKQSHCKLLMVTAKFWYLKQLTNLLSCIWRSQWFHLFLFSWLHKNCKILPWDRNNAL